MKFPLFWLAAASLLSAQDHQWLRSPVISPDGQTIVFTHGGDLFTVPAIGGQAVPLTQHIARDFHPVWSPDSRTIAFASNRYGNHDIFTVPATGGTPERLTFHSTHDIPSTFTGDGSAILFMSTRQDTVASLEIPNGSMGELYQLPANPKTSRRVTRIFSTPAEAVNFSFSGKRFLYHDRKGYENQWRKHHHSSIARDIWFYDTETRKHRQVTTFPGEDRNPVWLNYNDMLYLSERSGSFNVWRRSVLGTEEPTQVTKFEKHPVRFLSRARTGRIAYGFHGGIYVQDDVEAQPRKLVITLRVDDKTNRNSVAYSHDVKEMAVSPDGSEVAFIARGEIFVTSVQHGITRRITNTPEQERSVSFHPEGRKLLYASERDSSWNLYTSEITQKDDLSFYHATAVTEELLLSNGEETFQPMWSPDGKKVAFLQDRTQLRVIDAESKEETTLLDGKQSYSYVDGDLGFEWSPDGENLLFTLLQKNRWSENIVLVPADGKGAVIDLTRSGYSDMAPRWGWKGEGFTWVSSRHGQKAHGSWGADLDVYAGFLTDKSHREFLFNSAERAELGKRKDDDPKEGEKAKNVILDTLGLGKKDDEEKEEGLKLDPEGVEDRIERLTIHSSRLNDYVLNPKGDSLYYLLSERGQLQLWVHNLHEGSTQMLANLGSGSGSLAFDQEGKNLFALAGGQILKIDPDSGSSERLQNGGTMNLDLAAEREQMFNHVWRQVREKFHRKDLHGVDWEFYGKEYRKFLPSITNNDDFAELLSEMLGELDASHTGAFHRSRSASRDTTASLGVYLDYEHTGSGIRILEVIPRSPLDLLDEDIATGTVIEKINGRVIERGSNYAQLLNNIVDQRTRLTLRAPDAEETKDFLIRPISLWEELDLSYQRWIKRMRAETERLSEGKIGWVHIEGMNDGAFREFFSQVFGRHSDKQALIVDTRFNGGGWLTEDLTTFLSGQRFLKFLPRGQDIGNAPLFRWDRPSAVIMGEGNYSDAHIFPYAYKTLGIGKLVGMPVAGTGTAVWWEKLIDSSLTFGIPQVSTIDTEGRYLENTELQPDIRIANSPEDRETGKDRQLEGAVKHLLSLPKEKEWPIPKE